MINFPGSTEESWMKMAGHRVKDIMKRLVEHTKKNPKTCPLMAKGK